MIAQETVRYLDVHGTYDGHAFVATGGTFRRARCLTARRGRRLAIFLVNPAGGTDAATIAAMKVAGVTKAIVLGDRRAVSDASKGAITAGVPCVTERLAGPNRYDTAVAVAAYGVAHAGLSWNRLAIATGPISPTRSQVACSRQGLLGAAAHPGDLAQRHRRGDALAEQGRRPRVRFLGDTGPSAPGCGRRCKTR